MAGLKNANYEFYFFNYWEVFQVLQLIPKGWLSQKHLAHGFIVVLLPYRVPIVTIISNLLNREHPHPVSIRWLIFRRLFAFHCRSIYIRRRSLRWWWWIDFGGARTLNKFEALGPDQILGLFLSEINCKLLSLDDWIIKLRTQQIGLSIDSPLILQLWCLWLYWKPLRAFPSRRLLHSWGTGLSLNACSTLAFSQLFVFHILSSKFGLLI